MKNVLQNYKRFKRCKNIYQLLKTNINIYLLSTNISLFGIIHIQLMDEVLKYIFEYLVMGQLKFGMENRFIILLKCNQNCPQLLATGHHTQQKYQIFRFFIIGSPHMIFKSRTELQCSFSFMKFLKHYFNDRISSASVFNYRKPSLKIENTKSQFQRFTM